MSREPAEDSGAERVARNRWNMSCLVPDLPSAQELTPYLREIDSNRWYTNFGPLVLRYEKQLAHLCGDAGGELHAVTFSSATLGLTLVLRAMHLEPGARVLLPALTFPGTLLAINDAGLTPVLADVDRRTWTLEPGLAESVVKHHGIRAVMPVAPFGYPVPLGEWGRFQAATGVRVLVDAAAALGAQAAAEEMDVPFVCSLHATKPLGAGEGGVLLTRDGELATLARRLSNFGFERYVILEGGTNAKLSEYHAAVGLAQLGRAPQLLERRKRVFDEYRKRLPAELFRAPRPDGAGGAEVPPAVLAVNCPGRAERAAVALNALGIETRRWYIPPLHRHPAFRGVDIANGQDGSELPVTSELADSLLGIPFHNFLDNPAIRRVSEALLAALKETG